MLEVDWEWLGGINLFQVAMVVLAVGLVIKFLVTAWPWFRRAIALVDALGQLPAFMDRVDSTLTGMDAAVKVVQHEVQYNGGGSVKDAQRRTENAVARTELGVKSAHTILDSMSDRLDDMEQTDEELREELERTKPRSEVNEEKEK